MSAPRPALDASGSLPFVEMYKNGTYLQKNPDWHIEESPFKAKYVLQLLRRNSLEFRSVCEVGCGVGETLRLLQKELAPDVDLRGYEISPQAHELSKTRENDKLRFELADVTQQSGVFFDLMLVLDVIEHLEDYFSFLRSIRTQARYKIFHIPLDISVQAVIREAGMLNRRNDYAHLHYFTKETALQTLSDTGYRIRDYLYTARSNELGSQLNQKLLYLPRAILFAIHKDFAGRLLGGYSLMVLAE